MSLTLMKPDSTTGKISEAEACAHTRGSEVAIEELDGRLQNIGDAGASGTDEDDGSGPTGGRRARGMSRMARTNGGARRRGRAARQRRRGRGRSRTCGRRTESLMEYSGGRQLMTRMTRSWRHSDRDGDEEPRACQG
jgi:hypothetical protein